MMKTRGQMAVTTYNTSLPYAERYRNGKVQVALVWNSRDENSPSSKKLNALANFLWRYGGPNRKVHLIHSIWANFQTSINNVPFLFGVPVFEKAAVLVIHLIFRRTGRHLFLTDNDGGKPPLLKRMLEDYGEFYFMSALRSFKRRVAYSNVGYDHIVGWRTSSIRRNSELPKWQDSLNEKYPHVVYEEHCKAYDTEQCESVVIEDEGPNKLEEELVTGLSRVSWEKVEVSFHSSKLKSAAHSLIQVKDPLVHFEGADVIQHMIDNFLV